MPLGELGAIRSENKRDMRVRRPGESKCFKDENLPRCIGNVVFAADDVRDPHLVIVHDHGKVVERFI